MDKKIFLFLIPAAAVLCIALARKPAPVCNTVKSSTRETEEISRDGTLPQDGFIDVGKVYGATSGYKIFKEETEAYAKRINAELAVSLKKEKDETKRQKLKKDAEEQIRLYGEALLQDVLKDVDDAIEKVADKQQLYRVYLKGAEKMPAEDYTDAVVTELRRDYSLRPLLLEAAVKMKSAPEKQPEKNDKETAVCAMAQETQPAAAEEKSVIQTEKTEKAEKAEKAEKLEQPEKIAAEKAPEGGKQNGSALKAERQEPAKPLPKQAQDVKKAPLPVQNAKAKQEQAPVVKETPQRVQKTEAAEQPQTKTETLEQKADVPKKARIVIQFCASGNKKGIALAADKVRKSGLPAYVQEGPVKDGVQWWRARVAAENAQQADEYMRTLTRLGYSCYIAGK
ncbi:MAG: hypothetical protein KBS54_01505 [Synergistaceae bacterium]|nr:hypothetical protein [Candidatus Equadaptatus faecalis]